jgi:POT family proton-dependent oligopeptide transporter
LPFLGGYLADHYFGKYRTIVAFSLPYILGQVLVGIESVPFLYTALALLAMGSGVIKPNISPLMGMTYDQQRPGQTKLRSDAFTMFYFAINVGSAASTFALPMVRDNYGYAVAFLFPAVLMAFALGFFALGKPFYAVETISKTRATAQQRRGQWLLLVELLGLFIMVPFFWSVFEQQPSTWTFFAADHLDLHFYGGEIPPDQLQFLNPVLILVLLPAMAVLWRLLARLGVNFKPTDKMLIGFILTVLSLVVMAAAAYRAQSLGRVSLWWEVAAYVLITAPRFASR